MKKTKTFKKKKRIILISCLVFVFFYYGLHVNRICSVLRGTICKRRDKASIFPEQFFRRKYLPGTRAFIKRLPRFIYAPQSVRIINTSLPILSNRYRLNSGKAFCTLLLRWYFGSLFFRIMQPSFWRTHNFSLYFLKESFIIGYLAGIYFTIHIL